MILIISFCIYVTVGLFFALHTQLVYHPSFICDLYFGYDNAFHETSFVRHPLLKVISRILQFFLVDFNPKIISVFLVVICSGLLAIQNLFLYKILKNILELSKITSIAICLSFVLFGSNILLSFTFDSYVFSACFLTIFFYYFLKSEKSSIPMKSQFFIGSFLVGGITITNFIKVIVLTFYSGLRKFYYVKVFSLLGIAAIVYLLFFDKVKSSVNYIASHAHAGNANDYLQFFFGSIFVIPRPVISQISYVDGSLIIAVIGGYYSDAYTVILSILLAFFLYVILKNRKHKVIQFAVLTFSIDVFIHIIVGLGIKEAYIFSGNYAFVFPIIWGVGFQSLQSNTYKNFYFYGLGILFTIFFVMNIDAVLMLYQFGLTFYHYC